VKFDPSAINSPLAMIALFVAIIELFLIFPVSKLDGRDRSVLVLFIVAYPIFIAGSFFIFLWNKPVNLYTPQTLSVDLQRALLPQHLNGQLAPDRAAITAIELKVTTLEAQIRDFSQSTQSSANISLPVDLAKLSDLEKLKSDLLARAEASGDLSRSGLATAAQEIRQEEANKVTERIVATSERLEKFKIWIEQKGLKVSVPTPSVEGPTSSATGLSFKSGGTRNSITLGPPSQDFWAHGLYVNAIAEQRKFEGDFRVGTGQLMWTTADYMASKFSNSVFPNSIGPYRHTLENKGLAAKGYSQTYQLFSELSKTFGDPALEAGVIAMLNEWNSKSGLRSSFESMVAGMGRAGVNAEAVSSVFDKYRARLESLLAEN
jgi:hypothetical protein